MAIVAVMALTGVLVVWGQCGPDEATELNDSHARDGETVWVRLSPTPGTSRETADRPGRTGTGRPAGGVSTASELADLFEAIRSAETDGNCWAVGDGGRVRGPYQISRAYWIDGGGRGGQWERMAFRRRASERIMLNYWQRWCPAALAAGNYQTLARIHNGGPAGATKPATLRFWRRVQSRLETMR